MSSKKANAKNDSSDKNAQVLRDIQARCPENKLCFECRQRGPTYVDMTIGSFVCSKCSGVLRGITPPHRIKSISMSSFTNEEIESIRTRGNAYNAKVWMGLYDFKARISLDTKDDDSVRELIVQKYEKKRFYVDPSHVRHTVEPEPEKLTNGPLHSPPSKFSSGLIGSTLQMHKNSPPPASAAIAKPSPTATPPPIKMVPPAASSERASTSSSSSSFGLTSPPLAAASITLSKPSPFSALNIPPVQQNSDPFGAIASSSSSSTSTAASANDFFSKNDSFANFDTANIYSSSMATNQLPSSTMPQPAAQIVDFGFPPMPTAPVPVAVAPVQPRQEAKKQPVMAAPSEDKYAALKDLDNIFKSSFELTSKPAIGDAEPFAQPPAPQKHVSVPASSRTYNPFAAEYSASPQPNTSPWPITGSPSGPGFGAASTSSRIPDFFPSPWDTPAAAPTSNQGDFFGGKNFSNPWSESGDHDKFNAFGFNKKNPFL